MPGFFYLALKTSEVKSLSNNLQDQLPNRASSMISAMPFPPQCTMNRVMDHPW